MDAHGQPRCGHCGAATLLPIVNHDKWGRCAFCIALALAGTVTGWLLTVSFWLFVPQLGIVSLLVGVSSVFSLVLSVHLVVYWRRRARARRSS